MESDRMSTIEHWPTPKSIRHVQVLLGFTNFYRQFIRKYAKIMTPLSNLQKNSPGKWEWTWMLELAIWEFKKAFTEALIHQHFDPAKPMILQMDASGFAIAGIPNEYDSFGFLRSVNIHSRKCSRAKQNYDRHDREILAIVDTLRQLRQYLEGANYKVLMQCDHKDLGNIQTSKELFRKKGRWAEILSLYDFIIQHLEGKKNLAEGPSWRPDYEEGY